jgi:hypothetical protein
MTASRTAEARAYLKANSVERSTFQSAATSSTRSP